MPEKSIAIEGRLYASLRKIILQTLVLLFVTNTAFAQENKTVTVGTITVEGDKITHKPIIYREIEFAEGDVLTEQELDEKIVKSRQNLLNRSLFNFVTISTDYEQDVCNILVSVVERWYIWPIPIVEYADRNFNVWWETKDFNRLNYGVDLRVENFRGRMENLNIIVKGGYDQLVKLRWQIPYLTKNQMLGMGFEGGYQFNHEIAYATEFNRYKFFKTDDSYARKLGFASANLTFRTKFNFLHQFGVGFVNLNISDSVLLLNPNYTYGETEYNFFSLTYIYKHDFRDYKPYPLTGYYFDVRLTKNGLGILSSDINQFTFDVNIDHYFKIWKRWSFAYGLSGRMTLTDNFQPYFLAGGIGLTGMEIRGYELSLINGQNIGIMKSNLKFTIIPKTNLNIKWIKTEKFGKLFYSLHANLFFDMGYAQDRFWYQNNPLNNQLLWGTGLGIDFVTYYDMVLRLEYSVNKQGVTGLYLSMVAPI